MISETAKRAFVQGEPDAVQGVYDECGGLVYSVAYKILGDHALAEDAVQETFERAWKAAHTFDPTRELEPWLAVIARRAAVDISRREARRCHQTLNEAESASRLGDDYFDIETLIEVRRALKELQSNERDIVYLQFYEGLTHVQIADRLRIPLGTVKSRSDRARRQLSDSLNDWDVEIGDVVDLCDPRTLPTRGVTAPTARKPRVRSDERLAEQASEPAVTSELGRWISALSDLAVWTDPPPALRDRVTAAIAQASLR
jgi:RNA polymerase sigma-70 factor, ECF subfamily